MLQETLLMNEIRSSLTRRRVSAVLFDMDGTLLDSEPVYYESEKAFFAGYGIDFVPELKDIFTGRGAVEMFRMLDSMFPDSPLCRVPSAERLRLKDEAYLALAVEKVKPFPEVVTLAHALAGRGVPLAIASGSSPAVIELMVRKHGLESLFPVRVSASEVPRGKPEPDVFLEAARRCGVAPAECLVLEDSRLGVAAALAAGMACIALPEPGVSSPEAFSSADLVVPGGASNLNVAQVLRRYDWTRC